MAQRYDFRDADGSAIIAVADADFFTDQMSADYQWAQLSSIRFYSDAAAQNQVTPTGGTVTVTGTPDGDCYLDIPEGTFDAADACNPARARPNAVTDMVKAKLTLSGVTGAAYFRAYMWRS